MRAGGPGALLPQGHYRTGMPLTLIAVIWPITLSQTMNSSPSLKLPVQVLASTRQCLNRNRLEVIITPSTTCPSGLEIVWTVLVISTHSPRPKYKVTTVPTGRRLIMRVGRGGARVPPSILAIAAPFSGHITDLFGE